MLKFEVSINAFSKEEKCRRLLKKITKNKLHAVTQENLANMNTYFHNCHRCSFSQILPQIIVIIFYSYLGPSMAPIKGLYTLVLEKKHNLFKKLNVYLFLHVVRSFMNFFRRKYL